MDSLISVFNWIGSFFNTIVETVTSIINILASLFTLIFQIIFIFPSPLYEILFSFISFISIIYVYKIFRKG